MKFKITNKQFKLLKESVDPEVQDFFSSEKGKVHLLGPIPTTRIAAADAIKRILKSENKQYKFGDNIDLNELSLINRIRFGVYLDQIMKEKGQVRGLAFEGFMTGLFGGNLPNQVNYWFDYRVSNNTFEQKFRESLKDNPQLKTFSNFYEKNPEYKGLLKLPNTSDEIIKKKLEMLNKPEFLPDYFVFSYATKLTVGYEISNRVLTKDEVIDIVIEPENNLAPQSSGQTAIRISYTKLGPVDFTIKTPRYTDKELSDFIKLNPKERAMISAFGKHSDHIRPDVIKDLAKNLDSFIESLIEIQEEYG